MKHGARARLRLRVSKEGVVAVRRGPSSMTASRDMRAGSSSAQEALGVFERCIHSVRAARVTARVVILIAMTHNGTESFFVYWCCCFSKEARGERPR
jgi:hypothetical protein